MGSKSTSKTSFVPGSTSRAAAMMAWKGSPPCSSMGRTSRWKPTGAASQGGGGVPRRLSAPPPPPCTRAPSFPRARLRRATNSSGSSPPILAAWATVTRAGMVRRRRGFLSFWKAGLASTRTSRRWGQRARTSATFIPGCTTSSRSAPAIPPGPPPGRSSPPARAFPP